GGQDGAPVRFRDAAPAPRRGGVHPDERALDPPARALRVLARGLCPPVSVHQRHLAGSPAVRASQGRRAVIRRAAQRRDDNPSPWACHACAVIRRRHTRTGMMQSPSQGRARTRRIGVLMALGLLTSCSTYHGLFGARPATAASAPETATMSASSAAVGQRFALFGFGEGEKKQNPAAATETPEIDWPGAETPQGASTVQQSGADNGSAALSLRYQANFIRFARECALRSGNVVMKVGVEGRVILGPAGGPGPITLPVRLAV